MTVEYTNPALVNGVLLDLYPPLSRIDSGGYSDKFVSPYRVRYENRWHRVYISQFSNVGTAYIIKGGKHLVLDTATEYALTEGLNDYSLIGMK